MTDRLNDDTTAFGPSVDVDTYGQLLLAAHAGDDVPEIMERSDGLIYTADPSDYFDPSDKWPKSERRALAYAKGRVLDIGCGTGRVALELQQRGLGVVAIDESPGCVAVSQARGVTDVRVSAWQEFADADGFDTIVLARNNFGLLGGLDDIATTLRQLESLARTDAVLISDSVAPSRGGDVDDSHFYRVRYANLATPWFRYLMFEPSQLPALIDSSGWEVADIIDSGEPRWNFVLRLSQ